MLQCGRRHYKALANHDYSAHYQYEEPIDDINFIYIAYIIGPKLIGNITKLIQ